MSPVPSPNNVLHILQSRAETKIEKPTDPESLVLEAWAQGFMVGALIIMSCITLANMRRGVLLHKLILLELVMGYWQGFFILFNQPIYGWWLSVAAIPLNASWCLHNVISWMKLKPFLSKTVSRIFIGTIILSFPYWIVEIYANFTYFHNVNTIFLKTRPWEALCRDPWWIAAAVLLMYNIKSKYDLTLIQIIRISPRFAVMLGAMVISIVFIVLDVLSVTKVLSNAGAVGINPFWKLSFVFKCLTDSVVLDDFKTALDRLRAFKISRLGSFAADPDDSRSKSHREHVDNLNNWDEPPKQENGVSVGDLPAISSTDGEYVKFGWGGNATQMQEHASPDKYANMARHASRDRDLEENAIDALDHVDTGPPRGASESHILSNRDSWPPQRSLDGSSDLDIDYAMAVREMTNSTKPKTSAAIAR